MSERDWQKDWKMCQYGTPTPWRYHVPGQDGEWAGYVYSSTTGERVAYDVLFDDGMFIAEAREALPYWLQQVRELKTVVEAAQEFLDTIDLAERTGADVIMPPVQWQALYKLRESLVALEKEAG